MVTLALRDGPLEYLHASTPPPTRGAIPPFQETRRDRAQTAFRFSAFTADSATIHRNQLRLDKPSAFSPQ